MGIQIGEGSAEICIGDINCTYDTIFIGSVDIIALIKTLENKIKQLEYTMEELYYAPPGGGPGFKQSLRDLEYLNGF